MDFYIVWKSFLMPADFPEAANADIKEFPKKAADINGSLEAVGDCIKKCKISSTKAAFRTL